MSLQIDHSQNKIGVQGQTLFTLPSNDGASGQTLITNGSSVLSFANNGRVSVSDNAPTSPAPGNGDLWYNSAGGRLYVYYSDGNTNQWVDASPDASSLAYIQQNVLPATDNLYNLGSASLRFANVYTGDVHLSNEGSANDVDGTWGSYTLQEGEDALFLINRRTGKKYKFVVEEV